MPNDGLRAINVYAISDGGRSLTLIDSGWAIEQARAQLDAALAQLGTEVRDVDRFLITHVHRDHYSQAVVLRNEFGTPIHVGERERPALEFLGSPDRMPLVTQWRALRETGATALVKEVEAELGDNRVDPADWPLPDQWLADRDQIKFADRTLDVVHTPGHTAGHVVFRDAEHGLLFSGDHVLPQITPSIALEPAPSELPLGDYLGSLELVRQMPDTWLLPAHGPATESAHARIDELLDHHRTRLVDTAKTLVEGAQTAAESAAILKWTRRKKSLSDLDMFNAMLAILETKAHLDLLVAQDRAQAQEIDGVRHYAAV
jgi:glyoxylase-like metal-dependent hydrolase (beta-lactamase superfamily II)